MSRSYADLVHDVPSRPPPSWFPRYSSTSFRDERLSMDPFSRILLATSLGAFAGAFIGGNHGGQTAALRFRAEHAHKLPVTSGDWYFYHKSKNYHVMLQGGKQAFTMALRLGFWSGTYFVVENTFDEIFGTKDFKSSVMGGLTVASGFSAWNRLPITTAARNVQFGLLAGLAFGLIQDARHWVKERAEIDVR